MVVARLIPNADRQAGNFAGPVDFFLTAFFCTRPFSLPPVPDFFPKNEVMSFVFRTASATALGPSSSSSLSLHKQRIASKSTSHFS